MRDLRALFLLFSLTTPAFGASPDGDAVLKTLGVNLREGRSLPMGTKTSYRCPEGLENMVGIPMASVFAALPTPDFKTGNQVSYFLTSPIPAGQLGGGFPEITFFLSASNTVERVTCFYSQ